MKQYLLYGFLAEICILSIITFVIYGIDKQLAKKHMRRVSEKCLLTLSFLGGAIGGLSAMNFFRHKTKHWYFWVVNYVALLLHVVILILLYNYA